MNHLNGVILIGGIKINRDNHIYRFFTLGILFLASVWLAVSWGVQDRAAAQTPAIVAIDPPSLSLKPGEQAPVTLRIQNVQGLYGVEVHIQFDPNIIEVVDADPAKDGIQIAAGDFLPNGFVAVNQVDNAAGKLDFAVTLLNPAEPVNGSGVVTTLTIKARAQGTSPIQFSSAMLATREAAVIASQAQNGAVNVSASDAPPTATQPADQQPTVEQPPAHPQAPTGETRVPAVQASPVGGAQPSQGEAASSPLGWLAILGGVAFGLALLVFILVLARKK